MSLLTADAKKVLSLAYSRRYTWISGRIGNQKNLGYSYSTPLETINWKVNLQEIWKL